MLDKSINKEEFFKIFSITEEYFQSTGLDWDELMKIYVDYLKLIPYLEKEAEHIVSKLIDSIGV
ncbi:MAG: GTP pyrophosphokinase, partial [Cetobacterium sp.]